MKRREKMLLGGLVAVLALWQGMTLLSSFVFEPVEERHADIIKRSERLTDKTKQVKRSEMAARKLTEWKQRSLPPNPEAAAALYQNWLIGLAEKSKLEKIKVTAGRTVGDMKSKGDTFAVISFDIEAEGTLARLRDFLFEFRQSGLLQHVSKLALSTDKHQVDPSLVIKLTVEGLALKAAPDRQTLLSDPKLADLPGDKSDKDRKDYESLITRNLFVRGYNGEPKPPGVKTAEEDPRTFVRLTAIFSRNGIADATLRDLSTNKSKTLSAGADFSFAGVDGKVVAIAVDFITLEIKGESWRMEMGDNLTQLKKLSPPANSNAGPGNPAAGGGV